MRDNLLIPGVAEDDNIRLFFGSIYKRHGAWFWRYYDQNKQKMVRLADVCDERTKGGVIALANIEAEKMKRVTGNGRGAQRL